MSLFRSAFTVGSFTLISRILGYVRDILIAATLGASFLADAFFVAFRLPNFFRTLSAEGAFNAAFVPMFSGKLASDGQDKAKTFARHVLSFMFFALLFLTIIMQIFMPQIMHVLAPGFVDNPEKFNLTIDFGRIVFPYLIFISMVSLFSGILNSYGKFAVAASTPIWLNVVMILAITILAKYTDTPAHALSYGVIIAGVVQLLWVAVAAYKAGVNLRIEKPIIDDEIKLLLKRMIPGIIGGGVTQINLWINTVIATTMAGAVSYLYYADRLVQFPLAIIGTAMGTALLPALSKKIKEKSQKEAIAIQNSALEMVLIFTIPAAFALTVIAQPLISVMFERGEFTSLHSSQTAKALIAYSIGLPAFVMIKIFAPGFFASGDTKTPVKIAFICMIVNIALSLSLIGYIQHIGLALATSAAAWLNSSLLCYILVKRGLFQFNRKILKRLVRVVLASICMCAVLISVQDYLSPWFAEGLFVKISALTILIFSGLLSFFLVAQITGGLKVSEIKHLIKG